MYGLMKDKLYSAVKKAKNKLNPYSTKQAPDSLNRLTERYFKKEYKHVQVNKNPKNHLILIQ